MAGAALGARYDFCVASAAFSAANDHFAVAGAALEARYDYSLCEDVMIECARVAR